jgi:hypothetical protein
VESNLKFIVTNTNDSGTGSLREAILKTSEHFGHDTIEVQTTGVIEVLQSTFYTLLPPLKDVTLNGNGIIIDGNDSGRHTDAAGSVRINNLTFRNGNSPYGAGSIWVGEQSDGDSLVLDCVLFETSRSQSDVFGGGALSITQNNVVKAINCTFSGNVADYNGGAVDLQPNAVLISDHCTFTANMAGGLEGAIYNNQGSLHLTGTIIANSLPLGIEDIYNVSTSSTARIATLGISTNENNLVESCEGDCPTFSISGQDPRLEPLEDNGGGTRTHALMPESPAISTEPDSNPMADGRGYLGTDRRDIGSYETNAVDPDGCDPTEHVSMAITDGISHLVNAHQIIGAENLISNGSTAIFRAGNFVELKPEFSIYGGSVLEVVIGNCIK